MSSSDSKKSVVTVDQPHISQSGDWKVSLKSSSIPRYRIEELLMYS